jgi:signal transduction histidine kinase
VDTQVLVNMIVELLHRPPGLQVVVQGELPTVHCEKPPLESVLRNLIGNAVKHHDRPQIAVVAISARRQRDMVEFCVRDNGPGIEPQYHARIFEVFQTLRPRDEIEGSGMGLAIVKKNVEAAGGTIWVESEPGRGAAFYFTWPLITP